MYILAAATILHKLKVEDRGDDQGEYIWLSEPQQMFLNFIYYHEA